MDPVSAFALSCNVIQLTQAAASTGQVIYKIYKTGKIEGIDDFGKRLGDLDKLLDDTKHLSQQPGSQAPIGKSRQTAAQILQTCSEDAAVLRETLQKLKTQRDGRRFAFAIKAVWTGSASKIENARLRLESSQKWLTASLIPVMAYGPFEMIVRNCIPRLGRIVEKDAAGGRHTHQRSGSQLKIADDIDRGFSAQADLQAQIHRQAIFERDREHSRSRLLESLRYSQMHDRINSIEDHTESTFDWIFHPVCEYAKGSFASWLLSTDTHFWIQGKAGSGKSTLMRKLWSDQSTIQLLSLGCDIRSSLVLKHGFWLPAGNVLQKNYKGMLFCLIHGILSSNASAIDWLLAENPSLRLVKEYGDWDERSLQETLFALLGNDELFSRTCIFLDGLDEIGSPSDYDKILDLIKGMASLDKSRIKVCTSSRPERPWSEKFRSVHQLRLEDLTKQDIKTYARKKLNGKLPAADQQHTGLSAEGLLEEIVDRSEGVFLWAHLATETLLNATADASRTEIEDLLMRLPRGMMNLYENILSRREETAESVKAETATYLRLCLASDDRVNIEDNRFPREPLLLHRALLIWKTVFSDEEQYWWRTDEQTYRTDMLRFEDRIQDICCGLLKPRYGQSLVHYPYFMDKIGRIQRWPGVRTDAGVDRDLARDLVATNFEFSHRSVADFLAGAPSGREFMDRCVLTPQQLLFSQIDAELLRCKIWQKSQVDRSIAFHAVMVRVVKDMTIFARTNAGSTTEEQLLEAIYRFKAAISSISSFHQEQDGLSTPGGAPGLVFDLARATNLNLLNKDCLHLAHDAEGLLLEFGIDVWFRERLEPRLWAAQASSPIMATTYKNYLLLCATKGNLPVVARRLIDSGADFYADQYLPISRPEKHSAAGELLIMSGNHSSGPKPDDLCLWAEIASSCSAKVQFQLYQPFWRIWADSTMDFMRFFYSTGLHGSLSFVLDVSANLNLWLRHAASNGHTLPIIDPNTCVGFAIMPEKSDRDFSIQPFFAKSWGGLSYCPKKKPEEQLQFPKALPAQCSQCMADANDGFWKLLPDILEVQLCHRGCELDTASDVDKMIDLKQRPTMQRQEKVAAIFRNGTPADKGSQDLASTSGRTSGTGTAQLQRAASRPKRPPRSARKLAAELGFYKEPADPCVAQCPLPMFESVSTNCS
ncbi:uncharacterized protein HMPREF1541_00156 [Cyphellophora europaea CBS 101466]|uniref:Nephrocystin 3-like N-terminal domain-containing protein n=1 Tax=Cyphellophora europaea (strain CBS 101466) TaxID=1220924 RepID=W2SDK7_CYPE1|nr:uncharacterized protein HMPREF1541_00156 [Cyphellophora europaea CBS 101466]ETN45974.1 hypothetical protein HMPREF1541_00156 [Cyphellophora europaea CBS 101466]